MIDSESAESAGAVAPATDASIPPPASAPPAAPEPAPTATARDFGRLRLQIAVIIVFALAFGWLLVLLIGNRHANTNGVMMVLLAVVSLASGVWGALRRWRDYASPLNQLTHLLPQVRLNQAPIEELTSIKGGLEPVIPLIQDLLRDLRRERVQNAIL